MSMRLILPLATAMLLLPQAARADCAARIAAVESHPAVDQAERSAPDQQQAGREPSNSGGSVQIDGGDTGHAQGGPATPSESWFTDSEHEDRASVLAHLDTARKAQGDGKEQACLTAVEQAEAALEGR